MKTRTWVMVIAGILILAVAATGLLYLRRTPGSRAQILRAGEVIAEIDLSEVTEAYTEILTDERGSNRILVEPGRICILAADCPDQVCVRHGWISTAGDPIVCLPHKLTIQILGDGDADEIDTTAR